MTIVYFNVVGGDRNSNRRNWGGEVIMQVKQTLTTGDIARYCGVNFRTVIRWIERGNLKAYQLPGRGDNRISVEDFVSFLEENSIPIPAEFQRSSNRVLIVESDYQLARVLQGMAERAGFDVRIVADAFRAGTMLGTFLPDVVTLDRSIPEFDSHDIFTFLRATPGLERLKIMVVTDQPQRAIDKAIEMGADDVLQKPFKHEDFIEKLTGLIKGGASRPANVGLQRSATSSMN